MLEIKINRNLNKLVIGVQKNTITKNIAIKKMDNLTKLIKKPELKGKRRSIKNEIFRMKKVLNKL